MEQQAQTAFTAIASADELEEGQVKGYSVGATKIVICRRGGRYYAMYGICSHAGGPLCRGELDGEVLVCPWHGWEFNLESGICEIEPTLRQQTYEVKVEDGQIWVAVYEA